MTSNALQIIFFYLNMNYLDGKYLILTISTIHQIAFLLQLLGICKKGLDNLLNK